MTIEEIRSYCMALPGVSEDIKWDDHLCFNIGAKMFLVTSPDSFPISASFKTTDVLFEELSDREGFVPAPYMARYKWILVDDIARIKKSEWEQLIQISYDLVFSKLSAKAKKAIDAGH